MLPVGVLPDRMEPDRELSYCNFTHRRLVPSASPGGQAVRLAAGRPYPLPWPGGPGSPKVASGANPLPLHHGGRGHAPLPAFGLVARSSCVRVYPSWVGSRCHACL